VAAAIPPAPILGYVLRSGGTPKGFNNPDDPTICAYACLVLAAPHDSLAGSESSLRFQLPPFLLSSFTRSSQVTEEAADDYHDAGQEENPQSPPVHIPEDSQTDQEDLI